ncbi:MAG: S-methyl-5-thioribose-1-phosphate isomerase [Candidatus Tectomicrobia bacterium]|nr:S-methyl-5-thioribose-1-phosphate isomerase [Candidatus Tectomicrobia bacterium]
MTSSIRTIEILEDAVRLLDQRKLPTSEEYVTCRTAEDVAEAIRTMVVRGAPAIGVSAAAGIALGMRQPTAESGGDLRKQLDSVCELLAGTRPTAVNLFWAIQRMRDCAEPYLDGPVSPLGDALAAEARRLLREDVEINRRIGEHGLPLVPPQSTILTHCNAGALATAGYGTALGVIRAAHYADRGIQVFADETRPFLQGARLTTWELQRDNIPVSLITDNMAGYFMRQGKIDMIIVGADRIAANGDTANKIGTYGLAVLAREHGLPFYVAAPLSTIDRSLLTGDAIPIEQRHGDEVRLVGSQRIAAADVAVANPAFDVTPAAYIRGIITEVGVASPPSEETLASLFDSTPSTAGDSGEARVNIP